MLQTGPKKTIIDGDWGADEFQLSAVALARDISILGATSTFGNVSQPLVLENARRILSFVGADNVRLFRGAEAPSDRKTPLLGDGAHPVIEFLPPPDSHSLEQQDSSDFILETLANNPPGSVNITASGPLTNIKVALERDAQTMTRVNRLVIMGGCTVDMKAVDMPFRRGNITPHAEFNFQQAAADAKAVMESGLPITLLPMNCTHQLTFTPERHAKILELFRGNEFVLRALLGIEPIQRGELHAHDAAPSERGLFNAPAHLDMQKFGAYSVMHDVHCALYMLHPEQYEMKRGRIGVQLHQGILDDVNMWGSIHGHTEFIPDEASNTEVAFALRDPDFLFDVVADSLRCVLGR